MFLKNKMSQSENNNTGKMLINYNQFLVSIETNIINEATKRNEVIERLEEMYLNELQNYHLNNLKILFNFFKNNNLQVKIY